MLEFQKKKKVKNWIYSKLTLVVILVLIFFFAKAVIGFYERAAESKIRKERAETELQNLQQRKYILDSKIERLNSSVGIEEELRERFDLIKEGEQVILIGDNQTGTSSENPENQ